MKKLSALLVSFLLLFTFLLILSSLSFNLNSGSKKPNDSQKKLVTHLVFYRNKSFQPANITINKGEGIKFINESTEAIESALGTHPDHKNVPGFEEKLLKPGEEYTFTLTQPGVFNFHNHLHPSASGFISVK